MKKSIRIGSMVLIGWFITGRTLWADQTPQDSWIQSAEATASQVSANEGLSNFANIDNPAGLKGSDKSIKLGGSSNKTSAQKKGKKKSSKTKKSTTKKSKKSKSGKSRKKSKTAA
jgi:hypothetical protein